MNGQPSERHQGEAGEGAEHHQLARREASTVSVVL